MEQVAKHDLSVGSIRARLREKTDLSVRDCIEGHALGFAAIWCCLLDAPYIQFRILVLSKVQQEAVYFENEHLVCDGLFMG